MGCYDDRRLRRDVHMYADSKLKKYKAPDKMMDALDEIIAECIEEGCKPSPYFQEVADRLDARLRDLENAGKLTDAQINRRKTLSEKLWYISVGARIPLRMLGLRS